MNNDEDTGYDEEQPMVGSTDSYDYSAPMRSGARHRVHDTEGIDTRGYVGQPQYRSSSSRGNDDDDDDYDVSTRSRSDKDDDSRRMPSRATRSSDDRPRKTATSGYTDPTVDDDDDSRSHGRTSAASRSYRTNQDDSTTSRGSQYRQSDSGQHSQDQEGIGGFISSVIGSHLGGQKKD